MIIKKLFSKANKYSIKLFRKKLILKKITKAFINIRNPFV